MAREKQFENKIKKFLDNLPNVWHFKEFATAGSKCGVPDIICCINSRFVALEVKAENGKPSALQERNIRKIRNAGGYAVIVYPSQWEEVKEELIKISEDRL